MVDSCTMVQVQCSAILYIRYICNAGSAEQRYTAIGRYAVCSVFVGEGGKREEASVTWDLLGGLCSVERVSCEGGLDQLTVVVGTLTHHTSVGHCDGVRVDVKWSKQTLHSVNICSRQGHWFGNQIT